MSPEPQQKDKILEPTRTLEALSRTFLDSALDCIITMDASGRVQEFNPASERVFGFTRSEAVGKELAELIIPPSLRERHRQGLARYLKTGEGPLIGKLIEIEALRRDGSEIMVALAINLTEVDGSPIFTAYLRDITERKRAEETLRQNERQFRTLANSIPQLAWMADREGYIFWYNDRWYDYTGTTLEEMQGWGWQKVHHPDEVGRVVERIKVAFNTGEPWEDTFPLRSKNGEYRWFLSRALPIKDAEGRVVRWFGTNTDITEQRELEQALRESERQFRTLANSIPQLAWMADREGYIFWYNDRWYGYTGTTLEEMQGWGWQKVHHPDEVGRVVERIKVAFNTGAPWEDTFPLRSKSGEYRWFLSRALPIKDAQGQVVRWFGTNTDITEQRELEQALRESRDQLEQKVTRRTAELSRTNEILRSILSNMGDAVIVADKDNNFLVFNPAAERMFGKGAMHTAKSNFAYVET